MDNPIPVAHSPKHTRKWPKVLFVVAVIAAIGSGVYWAYAGSENKPNKRNEKVPVTLVTIGKGDIDIIDRGLGTVTPLADVTVRTQIAGQIQEIAFQEGQIVQKGDFLAQIDPRPYQMALEQAAGALQRDQALLKEAQIDLVRYQKLVAQDSISKQQLDTQTSLVSQYQGNVETDQGQVDAAKLNIDYCHITAPVGGRVGLRQVDIGNYAQTSDANGIVALTQLDPISVIFTLPEDNLPAVMKKLSAGTVLDVAAYDRDDTTKLADGKLTAVDNEINVTTGTVKLRAQFDNPTSQLFPNQFVNAHITVDTIHDAVVAPQAAILRGAPGTFVYLANDDQTVSVRVVKLGASQDDKVEITDGLKEGDKVVTDGTDKLRDGAKFTLPDPSSDNAAPAAGDKPAADDGKKQHKHSSGN
jgi:multidrug efflux system membrane fusion protein